MTTRKPIVLISGLFEEVNTPTDGLDFAGNTTTNLTEGTNLYYTDTRARLSISAGNTGTGYGSISYSNSTGVLTYSVVTDLNIRGALSVAGSSGLTYNSTTGVFGTSAIPNAQLANSSLTVGSTSIALGSTATSIAGLTALTATTLTAGTGGHIFTGSSSGTTTVVATAAASGTLTLPATTSTLAVLGLAQSYSAAQRGTISVLTSSSSITPDFAVANNFSLTLGVSTTIQNPSNLTAGQSGAIVITQDGTGSRTIAYGSYFKFSGGTPTATTTANAVDVLVYYVESATRITARLITNVA